MVQFGYSRSQNCQESLRLQTEILQQNGVTKVIVESSESLEKSDLKQLLDQMNPGDALMVSELKELGCSTRQLGALCQELKTRDLHLVALKEGMDTRLDWQLAAFIMQLGEMESILVKERTILGLKEARKKGKIGGRPKVNPKTVEKIRHLYFDKQETIPAIAKKCQVSVGTCYKYISLKETSM